MADGLVAWMVRSDFLVSCSLDMTYFPMDQQSCSIDVSLQTHTSFLVNFTNGKEPTIPQVYIPKRRTLIQALPPTNVYNKLFGTCSCIFTYSFVGHSCIYAIRPVCIHHGVCIECLIAILRQNAYMHEQITKYLERRMYLYECICLFGYLNL